MVQELKSKVVIVGGGPAGCICAYFLQNDFEVTVIEKNSPLKTLLPTGGGRCNLCHAEFDFKELAKNYPRGEKFLYSVFSKFSTSDTIEFFEKIGVETYVQENLRVFPQSNSAKDVRDHFLNCLNKVKFVRENALRVNILENGFSVVTDMGAYKADYVVISTGGHSTFDLIKMLGHRIVAPKPALVGLLTKEDFSSISGVVINDVLFTHRGISGPKIYTISSLRARDNFPYKLSFNFIDDIDLQDYLNQNPHKSIRNLIAEFVPKSFADYVLYNLKIEAETKCYRIDGKRRDKILDRLHNFEVTVTGTLPDGEVVTAGGVDLKEINSKNMESKIVPHIYFCGEVLDIDGFCGGFNLQNCWSTGYVAAQGVINTSIV
ncbi:putative uncharacterized protein [Clostridium sp. CAG:715]|nr:putative uncharacterized protein [Clostridium sp. CAG:715]